MTKYQWASYVITGIIAGLFIIGFTIPMVQSYAPHTYSGTLTYKSPIQSLGIGIGAENNIYLVIGNNTITCQLLNMNSIQQTHILTLQVNQTVTVTTIGQGICDTK